MRPVSESRAHNHLGGPQPFVDDEAPRHHQPLLQNPLLGRHGAHLGEITLKGGERPARVVGKLLQRQVFGEMMLQKIHQINFPSLVKIK